MSYTNTHVRRLDADDAASYREVRLEGLRSDPAAFGSTFERESAEPLSWFVDRVSIHPVFGAFEGDRLVGIAGMMFNHGKRAHIAMVWGMYVRVPDRNRGVGRMLLDAVLDLARERVEIVELSVIVDNVAARRLYASAGFVEYGVEKKALKQDGRYFDEALMALEF